MAERDQRRPSDHSHAGTGLKAWKCRANGLRIDDPALDPIRLQAPPHQEDIGSDSGLVVLCIAGGMTLQAGGCRAAEQATRHLSFLRS